MERRRRSGTRNWIGQSARTSPPLCFSSSVSPPICLPLLLLAAAWRRFRTRRIRAPLSRIVGLVTCSSLRLSALLALSSVAHCSMRAFSPAGWSGTLIARVLASGLNTVGATVLLVALAATGLLLATNFSFVRAYEWLVGAFGNRFAFCARFPKRFDSVARKRVASGRTCVWRCARLRAPNAKRRATLRSRSSEKTGPSASQSSCAKAVRAAERSAGGNRAIKRAARAATQPAAQQRQTEAEEQSFAAAIDRLRSCDKRPRRSGARWLKHLAERNDAMPRPLALTRSDASRR